MRQKLIKNLKKEERIKFPKFSYKVYENESLDLTGMTGMVIDDEQSNITIELDDEKYKETLYPDNCVGLPSPEHKNLLVEVIDPGGFICPECGSNEYNENENGIWETGEQFEDLNSDGSWTEKIFDPAINKNYWLCCIKQPNKHTNQFVAPFSRVGSRI